MNAVRSLSRHWLRTQDTPNADRSMADGVQILHGSGDPVADAQAVLDTLDKKPRKDAVPAIEGIASVSEAYFRPDGSQVAYERDPAKVEAWSAATMKHLHDQFGERLVSAVIHLDEQTPHIQFLLVPIETKERRPAGKAKDRTPRQERGLNAKGLMGNRDTLSAYQSAYEAAMRPLGVGERTRKVKRAPDRSTVQEWYGRQEQATNQIEAVASQERARLIREGRKERILDGKLHDVGQREAAVLLSGKAVEHERQEARRARMAAVKALEAAESIKQSAFTLMTETEQFLRSSMQIIDDIQRKAKAVWKRLEEAEKRDTANVLTAGKALPQQLEQVEQFRKRVQQRDQER